MSSATSEWRGNQANQDLIAWLKEAGINPQLRHKGNRLQGKTPVFTGGLRRMTCEEASEEVIRQGGRVSGSVSRDYRFPGGRSWSRRN